MDVPVFIPTVDDHFRLLILVRQLGSRNPAIFNRLMERLNRIDAIEVSQKPRRLISANFLTTLRPDWSRFSELQAHRRILGLIGVAIATEVNQESSSTIVQQYETAKTDFGNTLVDSRCAVFGYGENNLISTSSGHELIAFPSIDEAGEFENGIRELLRSIYIVLESRRMDLALEKLDTPICPLVPDEEKYRVGVDKSNKITRKKILGRLRKQMADYALLTGLPDFAFDVYQSAIDALKQTNDLLWLAAALEGWSCAAMALKWGTTAIDGSGKPVADRFHRVPTMTPDEIRHHQARVDQHLLGTTIGHQRYRSEEDTTGPAPITTWFQTTPSERTSPGTIEFSEIINHFKTAIENYERFSFAVRIQYECVMKAAAVFRQRRKYAEMEFFLRDQIGKFLEDSCVAFDQLEKSAICQTCAALYKSVGFHRKEAFYSRLGMFFRLYVGDTKQQRTEVDYRHVYPVLYRSLAGYGIPEACGALTNTAMGKGPVQVQIRAVHEVFMSASHAGYHDAAIRHLCYILQAYYDDLDAQFAAKLFHELNELTRNRDDPHLLHQHLNLDGGVIILPPIQLTRFPMMSGFQVMHLSSRLAPTIVPAKRRSVADVFIYSPFQNKRKPTAVSWVVDCACEVAVHVRNCATFELAVFDLALITDGCAFETVPVRLNLAPSALGHEAANIKLIGVPRAPGHLTITGYSCQVLGVKNICKLPATTAKAFNVDVLPALPLLDLETSLIRAPITEQEQDPAAETTVYSGQSFDHLIFIYNNSPIAIRSVEVDIKQPKVCGGPPLLHIVNHHDIGKLKMRIPIGATTAAPIVLNPGERREIQFRIFGIDPTSTADDSAISAGKSGKKEPISEKSMGLGGQHDTIPYTGRLLTAEFEIRYIADVDGPGGELYERTARLPLAVSIVPAVIVSDWHVLPGDGPLNRYVVIDVTNATDADAELTFSGNRMIGVQSRDVCRVPLLCPCCSVIPASAFKAAADRPSHMMQMQEMEKLRRKLERHIASHLAIRWSIPQLQLEGLVPVGSLLSSIALLKQLVVPSISIDVTINGNACTTEDVTVGLGEVVNLQVQLLSSAKGPANLEGILQLRCYQEVHPNKPMVDRSDSIIPCGAARLPFEIKTIGRTTTIGSMDNGDDIPLHNDYQPSPVDHSDCSISSTSTSTPSPESPLPVFAAEFGFAFRFEGTYKIKPVIVGKSNGKIDAPPGYGDEELFVPVVSFNVITKM